MLAFELLGTLKSGFKIKDVVPGASVLHPRSVIALEQLLEQYQQAHL
jgi:hypothetical protein